MNRDLSAAILLSVAFIASLLFAINSSPLKSILSPKTKIPISDLPLPSPAATDQNVSAQISTLLPRGSFLRDLEPITGAKPPLYLFIYLEPGFKIEDWALDSCPGQVLGQAIAGNYHLALFQNNQIIEDIVIPSAYLDQNASSAPLQLTYRNLSPFPSSAPSSANPDDLQVIKLLKLTDYTGDKLPHEILLTTTQGGCGFTDGLVAGVNPTQRKLFLYSNWIPRLNPSPQGVFDYLFDCGDHGNQTKIEKRYRFNPAKKYFEVVSQTETPCE